MDAGFLICELVFLNYLFMMSEMTTNVANIEKHGNVKLDKALPYVRLPSIGSSQCSMIEPSPPISVTLTCFFFSSYLLHYMRFTNFISVSHVSYEVATYDGPKLLNTSWYAFSTSNIYI